LRLVPFFCPSKLSRRFFLILFVRDCHSAETHLVMDSKYRTRTARLRLHQAIGDLPHHSKGVLWLQQQAAWDAWNEHFVLPDAKLHGSLVEPVGPRDIGSKLLRMPPLGPVHEHHQAAADAPAANSGRKRKRDEIKDDYQGQSKEEEEEEEEEGNVDEVEREIRAAQAELRASWQVTQPGRIRLTRITHELRGNAAKLYHLAQAERRLISRYRAGNVPPRDVLAEWHRTMRTHNITTSHAVLAGYRFHPNAKKPAASATGAV
jgi:hypothetical protein